MGQTMPQSRQKRDTYWPGGLLVLAHCYAIIAMCCSKFDAASRKPPCHLHLLTIPIIQAS